MLTLSTPVALCEGRLLADEADAHQAEFSPFKGVVRAADVEPWASSNTSWLTIYTLSGRTRVQLR
jgi:hypothetical protein